MGRTVALFRLFLSEQSEPDQFYCRLAADSVTQLARFADLPGRLVVDVGGGPGHVTAALQACGAHCLLVEPDVAELRATGSTPAGAVRGDGMRLPLADDAVDVCFSSNVLEHVRDPAAMLAEMVRVTRPDGVIYLAFTNWYSPWGGHEMSPWHYFGPRYAQRRYRRRTGKHPKNRPGTRLFPVHVGATLRGVRARRDVVILAARPRYYPAWTRFLLRIPGLREVVTWNLLLVLRKTTAQSAAGPITVTSGRTTS